MSVEKNLINDTDQLKDFSHNELLVEVVRLRDAIRNHRDQRGDDRCWLDDEQLYATLPEGYQAPKRDTTVELHNCEKYIKSRQNPNTVYVSPERRIEELEAELKNRSLR